MTDLSNLPRLGLGCWPLSGPFYRDGQQLGYANADPAESLRAIEAAYDHGIRIFDTAAVYGAGKGERLVGQALSGKDDVYVISKIGLAFDEETEELTHMDTDPANVLPAIDACRARLGRDCIDLMLLHPNEVEIDQSRPIFDAMEEARAQGKIGSFGWSTDFPEKIAAHTHRDGFAGVEHAMHIFFDARDVRDVIGQAGVASLARSPLAMGALSGKYVDGKTIPSDDIRAGDANTNYFRDGRINPDYQDRINAVRALLQTGGRSLVQGALGWVMAAGPTTIPLPGARTVAQISENARALEFGPLPRTVMDEIASLIDHKGDGEIRAR